MVNFCYAVDENLVDQVLTSIYSLTINVHRQFTVNVIAVNCAEVLRRKIGLEFKSSNPIFNIIEADAELYSNWTSTINHITPTMYQRLSMTDYLPTVDRVLYLDADVLVVDDIAELLDVNLDGRSAAAVDDRLALFESFNSGVMLVDLKKLRSSNFINDVNAVHENCPQATDQAILNFVLGNDVLRVNPVFNCMVGQLKAKNVREFMRNHGRVDVRVLHFAGPDKPWDSSNVPAAGVYKMYANRDVNRVLEGQLLRIYVGKVRNERQ